MLPPIEDSTLQINPQFALLHSTLQKNILNPSGSTKHHPAQKERDVVSEALKTARIRAAKSYILLTALTNLDLSPAPTPSISIRDSKPREQTQHERLPVELNEIVLLLSTHLTIPSLPPSSMNLLNSSEQWNDFPKHTPAIGTLVSTYLHTQAWALARIASPSTNASFLHRGIPKLVSSIQDLQREIEDRKVDIQARRMSLVSKTTTVLGIYHLAISLVIRILEQSKHGAVARHIKMKVEYLNVAARSVELEAREKEIRGLKMVYSEELRGALENYVGCLRDGRERLRERRGDMERILGGYGFGRRDGEKEKVMREIARVYGELVQELIDVGRDVERLMGK